MNSSIKAKRELIDKLKAVVDDNGATDAEKENARIRIAEIENKLSSMRSVPIDFLKYASSMFGSKSRLSIDCEPPFGWTKKRNVYVATVYDPGTRHYNLEWKCPNCDDNVERTITASFRAKLLSIHNGVELFIRDISVGAKNQLCDKCYHKFR